MKKIFKIVLIGSLGLVACKKAELKKPVDVNFALEMVATEAQNPFHIQGGEINLVNFDVSGDRIEGDDISFMRSFPENLTTDLNGSGEIKELDYDLPQGDYTDISLSFSAKSNQTQSALIVYGKYINGGFNANVELEIEDQLDFIITGEESGGQNLITLDKSMAKKVDVQLNVAHWFSSVSEQMWTSADLSIENNQDVIVINSTTNQDIYNSVLANSAENNKAIFKN